MGLGQWKIYTQLRVKKTLTETSNHMTKPDQCIVLTNSKQNSHTDKK